MICFVTLFLEVLSGPGNVFGQNTVTENALFSSEFKILMMNVMNVPCLFWQNMHEHKRKYFHLNSTEQINKVIPW